MDCSFGMGREDGRSHGGAVSSWVRAENFLREGSVVVFLFVLLASFSLASCTREGVPAAVDPQHLLEAVAPADPTKFPDLEQSKHWSNPYVVIRPSAVAMLTAVTANEEQLLKPDDVLKALSELPASAWPYGRAVAVLVEAKRSSSEEDKIALRRNRGIVAGELQSAHVAIHWIPSS
jgi:hypothetical protein